MSGTVKLKSQPAWVNPRMKHSRSRYVKRDFTLVASLLERSLDGAAHV